MNDIGIITLANGGFTVVDVSDFDSLNQFVWRRHPQGYAYRMQGKYPQRRAFLMHRALAITADRNFTDHKNRCKLDNTRRNLRDATPTQSGYNKSIGTNNTSGYKGVSWNTKAQRWVAQLKTPEKLHWLGYYKTAESAAAAYDEAAKKHCGEFAVLNGVEKSDERCGRLRGAEHPCTKFSESDVLDILARLKRGESQRGVARLYETDSGTICRMAHGKTWAHLHTRQQPRDGVGVE